LVSENELLLREAFDAIGRADTTRLGELYADDYVVEFPYGKPSPTRVEGLADVLPYLDAAFQTFRFTLTITNLLEFGDTIVAEYTSDGTVVPTGQPYNNTYIGIWTFRDGKVASTREYYDPVVAADAYPS
jgi:ketosteroid isomerase-like protein